jgi:DNA-binding CsgD family transcriptional regulator
MEREDLERYLAEGLSLEQMAERIGRHPSTVSYHLKKYGLSPLGHDKHAANGKVDPWRLGHLVEEGASIRDAADKLGVSYSTVRHWLKHLDLETHSMRRRREQKDARARGVLGIQRVCTKHGKTLFVSRPDGGFRCGKCRISAVVEWRRRVKRRLAKRAGGACEICAYDRYEGALQFHHLDAELKEFEISSYASTRSWAKLCAEADKCALLCANCHAEVEAGMVELPPRDVSLRLHGT